MKKGCLIILAVLVVLLVLLAIGAFVAYRVGDARLGLSQSPVISHEEAVKGDTRIRFVLSPENWLRSLPLICPKHRTGRGEIHEN